jgi:hypothetical protein
MPTGAERCDAVSARFRAARVTAVSVFAVDATLQGRGTGGTQKQGAVGLSVKVRDRSAPAQAFCCAVPLARRLQEHAAVPTSKYEDRVNEKGARKPTITLDNFLVTVEDMHWLNTHLMY